MNDDGVIMGLLTVSYFFHSNPKPLCNTAYIYNYIKMKDEMNPRKWEGSPWRNKDSLQAGGEPDRKDI